MTDTEKPIAERLYDGGFAECELEELLSVAGVPNAKLGWDHYDNSLEIHGVEPSFRLTVEAQRAIHSCGFSKVYVNHTDKWETHYTFKDCKEFAETKGWRVSYPHKRDADSGAGIWVEEVCPGWPGEWFKTGYCIVKQPSNP